MKVTTIHSHMLEWAQAEWADSPQEQAAYKFGYELSVKPNEEKTWDWQVKMTAEISETPELVDAGTRRSESGAKIKAKSALNRANRERAKSMQPEPKAEKPEAKMTVSHQEPEAKTDLAEKTKAQVDKDLAAAKNPARKSKTASQMLEAVEESVA